MLPIVFSVAGTDLTNAERALFRDASPAGFILFNRNARTPDQVRRLTNSLRECTGRERLPILVDQEGGRVQMLRRGPAGLMADLAQIVGQNDNPAFPDFPAAGTFGRLFERDRGGAVLAATLNARLLGRTLREVGINVDCAPVLDVPQPGAHDVIGDRAFSADPVAISALGRAMLEGLWSEGVAGVIKHIPGHGRATADSHRELPTVGASLEDLETDLGTFRALADAPWAMTAHIRYTAVDAERPATQSETVIADIIRGRCGFNGILVTDALEMHALEGPIAERAVASIAAGCDLGLYCSGRLPDMEAMAARLNPMTAEAVERLEASLPLGAGDGGPTKAELAAERDRLLAA